jgi:hypothetical protein
MAALSPVDRDGLDCEGVLVLEEEAEGEAKELELLKEPNAS